MRDIGNRIAKALVLGAAVLGLCAPLAAAQAQANWPERAVKIIVPYPPGGTADVLGRLMAERLTEALKQSVIVENRPGAGGAIGAAAVARAAPDGYTLLMATIASHSIIPAIGTVPYDPIADFQPVVNVADTPNVLLVNVDTPYKSLADILTAARAKPGAITFGSTSLGGSPHMSGELLKAMAGVDLLHVPYKGGGPMLTDLIGGQVQLGFDNLPSSMPHIRSGKVRPIAVTTPERWPDAPEIPTIDEAGVPGYEVAAWFGILAPAGTPKPVVELLHRSSAEILKEPAFEKRLLELGAKPSGITPEQFSAMLERELGKWREVAAKNGLKL